jgi:hypothetical protein
VHAGVSFRPSRYAGQKDCLPRTQTLLVQDNIQDARIIAPTYFRNEAAQLVTYNFNLRWKQPENRRGVVCRALTNRTETPFLAQLLSLRGSGPLETPLQAFLIVG